MPTATRHIVNCGILVFVKGVSVHEISKEEMFLPSKTDLFERVRNILGSDKVIDFSFYSRIVADRRNESNKSR